MTLSRLKSTVAAIAVLAAIGARMKSELRGSDLKCRYGGDEFMVILPDTPLGGARQVSENLRQAMESQPINWNSEHVRITASFGVASFPTDATSKVELVRMADQAMYRVKNRTRNGVEGT